MKKYICIIASMIQALSMSGQSLVTTNKQWSNYRVMAIFGYLLTEYIKFTSDTMIDGLTYKMVERSTDEYQMYWYSYGFIREDSDKKVFYKLNVAEPERLFYDFNLQLNDTITAWSVVTFQWTYWIGVESQLYRVNAIDSILIGDTYRKQIHLGFDTCTSCDDEQWIDSTGNLGGILHAGSKWGLVTMAMDYYVFLKTGS